MPDPIVQFNSWMEDAKRAGIDEPTAMALATADLQGLPSVRMVLLKHADEHGFVFYTNLESAKAAQLKVNPQAELCFYWGPLTRQVRVTGPVERTTDAEADAYFATRPRLSQIGAWASQQSRPCAAAILSSSRPAPWSRCGILSAPCRGRPSGPGIGSCPSGSNSGSRSHSGGTSASSIFAMAVAGGSSGCFRRNLPRGRFLSQKPLAIRRNPAYHPSFHGSD